MKKKLFEQKSHKVTQLRTFRVWTSTGWGWLTVGWATKGLDSRHDWFHERQVQCLAMSCSEGAKTGWFQSSKKQMGWTLNSVAQWFAIIWTFTHLFIPESIEKCSNFIHFILAHTLLCTLLNFTTFDRKSFCVNCFHLRLKIQWIPIKAFVSDPHPKLWSINLANSTTD